MIGNSPKYVVYKHSRGLAHGLQWVPLDEHTFSAYCDSGEMIVKRMIEVGAAEEGDVVVTAPVESGWIARIFKVAREFGALTPKEVAASI